ncbi:MAG: hypothetical protein J1E31_00375 [Helicobacter sp.]|nr:hypothetical protein [Helicobacter sp.]
MEELNEIQSIEKNILEYRLKEFFKKNSQAIALIFKALIKGEKAYPKEEIAQEILRINAQDTLSAHFPHSNDIPLSSTKNTQKTPNSPNQNSNTPKTHSLDTQSNPNKSDKKTIPISPLNIEG